MAIDKRKVRKDGQRRAVASNRKGTARMREFLLVLGGAVRVGEAKFEVLAIEGDEVTFRVTAPRYLLEAVLEDSERLQR